MRAARLRDELTGRPFDRVVIPFRSEVTLLSAYGMGFRKRLVGFWNRWADRSTGISAADGGHAEVTK